MYHNFLFNNFVLNELLNINLLFTKVFVCDMIRKTKVGKTKVKKGYWGRILCLIAAVLLWEACFRERKPELVSCITVPNKAYLTVLADGNDIEKLEQTILGMCLKDEFETIKLHTEEKPLPGELQISVYKSRKDLKEGKVFLTIQYDDEGS